MKIRINENQLEAVEGIHTEYPYVLHHVDVKDVKIPWHWHEELEFDYVVRGKARFSTTNQTYVLTKDQACFMNSNVLSLVEDGQPGESCIVDSHLFHPVFLGGHFRSVFETKYLSPVLQNKGLELITITGENPVQREILKKLRELSALQREENVEFQTRNLLSEIWLLLLQEIKNLDYGKLSSKPANKERIQTMMSFIHVNYSEKITLEQIASSAAVSKRECLRCFQESIGKTPFEYLLDYRIEMAEKLLRNQELSITEVAMQTGFSNSAYFGKVFRKITGRTPGAFRKSCMRLKREEKVRK